MMEGDFRTAGKAARPEIPFFHPLSLERSDGEREQEGREVWGRWENRTCHNYEPSPRESCR